MSYLDAPRLCFSGIFIADPSTVNNTPQNYDPATTAPAPGWNPNGTGGWQFKGCTVTSATYADGTSPGSAADDPVLGGQVQGTDEPQTAKLVDLDTEQQMVSEIWGFHVRLLAGGALAFVGDFAVAAFVDIWYRATAGGSAGDAPMGACYQSVLESVRWGDVSGSRFLRELQEVSGGKLSLKFNLDGINMDSTSLEFTQGRVVGTIGPAGCGEPDRYVLGRLLRSAPGTDPKIQPMVLQGTPPASPMFFAPAKVEPAKGRLRLDLGNSLSTTTPGGPLNPALGDLAVAALPAGKAPVVLGDVSYQAAGWYTQTAGLVDLPLTADQLAVALSSPLAVVQTGPNGVVLPPFLQENSLAAHLRAETFVFRLNPGETAEVRLTATRFGKPAAHQQIDLAFDRIAVDRIQVPPNPPSIPIGQPESALQFPASVTTDALGRATFPLTASDPGNPRKFIDGQVYGVSYRWHDAPPDYNPDPTSFLSVLVFNRFPMPASPTWEDVQPILAQYAKLYPYMTNNVVNLGDYSAVKSMLPAIRRVLSLPKTDPGYMQVTRDMSRDRLALLLRWIELGAPA